MADNSKAAQHVRRREPGRRDGARSRRQSRVFASDDAVATRRRQLEQARAARDAKFAALLAEMPSLALSPYQLYRVEVEKRRDQGKPTCRPID